MCGVAGVVKVNNRSHITIDLLTRMLSVIRHRGPDESGFFIDDDAAIGNVRLSIIDLATGQQPMSNNAGDAWIVFNGEIFNYIELKAELTALGHVFKTTSDTEVLLHLYEEFGEGCLSKLNGQFVFAVWDTVKKSLFIARDRVGIRPLFYTFTDGAFVFASEIKAILEHPEVSPRLNAKAMAQQFTLWTPLPGYTLFEDIQELEPGHYMKLVNGKLEIKKFWELSFAEHGSYNTNSLEDAVEGFRALLLDSVKLRLRSDVPVAAYLSGGLDSSITTSLIKQVSPQHLQTFSIGFADADYDESGYQQEVSKYLNTQHVSFKCTSQDVADIFPEVVWHCEAPLFRTAPAPMYLLSKKVRENNIKVVMTGEGADEILAGYDVFKEAAIRYFWARYPNSKYRPLLLRRLYPYIPQITSMNARMLKFIFGFRLQDTGNPFYAFLLRWNNGSLIWKYFSKDIQEKINGYNPAEELESTLPAGFTRWDSLSRAQWVEAKLLMSNYLLSSQGDRMGMANSIEGRYPFLDYRVIEYACKVKPQFKMNGLNEKYLLKKMMNGRLPDSVVKRNKQAYRAPITSAFLSDKEPGYVSEFLDSKKVASFNLFNPEMVDQLTRRLRAGKNISENDTMALTAIISSQLFYAMYVDRSMKPPKDMMLLKPVVVDRRKGSGF